MEPDGLLLVNKPRGVTSHDVVQVLRRKLALRRIGHTGTLDPMAEGLLVLLIGRATKFQQSFQAHGKTYEATVTFGLQTDTGDADGRPVRTAAVPPLQEPRVRQVLASLEGTLVQTPPAFSAVKVHGRPAYWWARRRQPVVLASRSVRIARLALLALEPQAITVRIECSAGTYIRTLAETIAERLGTVGHVTRLTRLRIGQWTLDGAAPMSWFAAASREAILPRINPVTALEATPAAWLKPA